MFKINRRTDYAVRVGIALAKRPAGSRIATQAIQAEMQIPRPFLQRIIAELCEAGLILTLPGPNGGVQLGRPADEITLKDIVTVMEGPLYISDCINTAEACPLSSDCPVRRRWGKLQTVLLNELAKTSLLDLTWEALDTRLEPGDGNGALTFQQPAGVDAQSCSNPTI